MTDQAPDPAPVPAYGEDATAASMKEAADSPPSASGAEAAAAQAKVLPDGVAAPVAGTTETDLAGNIAQAAERKAALARQG